MAIGKKTGGRSKGTQNKRTVEQKNRAAEIMKLIEDKYFEKDLKKLSPAQRIVLYTAMMEYVAPKLSKTAVAGNVNHQMIVTIKRDRA